MNRDDIYSNRTRGELIDIIENSIDIALEHEDRIEDIICILKNMGFVDYEIAEIIKYRYVLEFTKD